MKISLSLALFLGETFAFTPTAFNNDARDQIVLFSSIERRQVLKAGLPFSLATAAFVSQPPSAWGAATPPTAEELARIKTGYAQLKKLLSNFEAETTTCRENGGECKRDAEPIRRALGLRSTTDPLFQIEKVFAKVKNMDIDPDKLEAFFEASEDWNSAMNMSNSMAFISQFGKFMFGPRACPTCILTKCLQNFCR